MNRSWRDAFNCVTIVQYISFLTPHKQVMRKEKSVLWLTSVFAKTRKISVNRSSTRRIRFSIICPWFSIQHYIFLLTIKNTTLLPRFVYYCLWSKCKSGCYWSSVVFFRRLTQFLTSQKLLDITFDSDKDKVIENQDISDHMDYKIDAIQLPHKVQMMISAIFTIMITNFCSVRDSM